MPASQHQNPKSDIEIAQAARPRRIVDLAKEKLGIAAENLEPYGHYKAKVSMDYIKSLKDKPNGKLILVSAITPTPAGEGKTTTTVGLTDALNQIGKKAMLCLREPSLGPSFGMKGGAYHNRRDWQVCVSTGMIGRIATPNAGQSRPIAVFICRSAGRRQ